MDQFLNVLVSNQLLAISLAGVVWVIVKWEWISRRPALVHGLWMLVLLKCLTPPLVSLPVLPSSARRDVPAAQSKDVDAQRALRRSDSPPLINDPRRDGAHTSELAALSTTDAITSRASESKLHSATPAPRLTFAMFVASLLVSAFIVCITAFRMRTIGRLLREPNDPSSRELDLLQEARRLVGPKKAPRLVIVDATVSPMLWVDFRGATIVLPKKLIEALDDQRLLHILVHEMAHFVRRDHASNILAFLVVSLFWWNPVLWLTYRQLHSAAEASCDALTIERLTSSRRVYAETLVMVVDYVTSPKHYCSSIATSFGESRLLRRRIEMIASSKVQTGLSRVSLLVLICAAAALPFMPTPAQVARAQENPNLDGAKAATPDKQPAVPAAKITQADRDIPGSTLPAAPGPKADAEKSPPEQEEEFTTSGIGPRNKNPKFRLPDYLPAAHGNMVEISPNNFFMLTPLGSTHKWHVIYRTGGWDEILTIPPLKDLRQGQTFVIHKDEATKVIAFVEAEYANDRDIGVKIIDNATGEAKHQCTLLMNVSRYQWVIKVASRIKITARRVRVFLSGSWPYLPFFRTVAQALTPDT